ncbi:type VI secretion system tip protein VgrG [Massilia sp. PAMC28688]|uniref:type VI secretion system Vgr family protein n=1 Tax=Massilia sp. PAMC28688 TaxID=2861283 RepID=UPI001C630C7C|nr:type VI secretion system tip protein TssI/VgrG [Massilia sp. PAMC28688]QYF95736.1 type VI secretion system tip protein VgrG [Massilia sp. PAMC28688]
MPVTQANRDVVIKSALADDKLLFASMSGSEQLGRLSEFTVCMLSLDADIMIADVLGKPLDVALAVNADGDMRHFNGIVTRFRSTGWYGDFTCYEATVHPWLWLLTRSSNCRIFQDQTVPDIVKEVCEAYGGVVALTASLSGEYPALPYCVQYRETDFNFVCRLLEGAGIYFYFTHTADKHTMVLADSYSAHQPIDGYDSLKFGLSSRKGSWNEETVSAFSAGGEIASSKFVLNDFNFEKPAASLLTNNSIEAGFNQGAFEMFDYPGNYSVAADGGALARARMESLHGQCEQITATTDARGLHPGGLFTLALHPRAAYNRGYLVTGASYAFSNTDYASGGGEFTFECRITAVGKEHAYRPLPVVPKPVVHGPQTAFVVGKAGEEIWTDKYGRVKVQFHWDRVGKHDEKSSCWVRVAQGWAGKGWGAFTLPRIGMEVVVSFLEGDPDRPLVTGCVYNASAMPPYALPAEQTISTVKSQSSKGGEGFNELRFEDKKGEEEVYIHAERDFLRVVKNNDALKVGFETAEKGDQTIDIKNDQVVKIGNDQTLTVTNDQLETIDNNQTVTIKADQKLDVGGDQTVGVDGAQKIKVGSTISIEAGTSIELKVGGSSIKIEGAKITIKSPEIEIAADASAKVKSGAMMEIKSGAMMTIAGALVQIN